MFLFRCWRQHLTTLGAFSVVFFLKENQKIDAYRFYLGNDDQPFGFAGGFTVSCAGINGKTVPAKIRCSFSGKNPGKGLFGLHRFYKRFIGFEKRYKWAFIFIVILGFGLPVGMLPDEIENRQSQTGTKQNFTIKHWAPKNLKAI